MNSMAVKDRALAAGASLLAAALTLILTYEILDWFLIKYWEWQHDSRRMAYTFWADFRAIPCAILASLVAAFLMYRFIRRRSQLSQSR